jgi:hypothetical protein
MSFFSWEATSSYLSPTRRYTELHAQACSTIQRRVGNSKDRGTIWVRLGCAIILFSYYPDPKIPFYIHIDSIYQHDQDCTKDNARGVIVFNLH